MHLKDVLNLGAGVQSTTVYVMAVEGRFPRTPQVAIFADTGDEPQRVYDHLSFLEKEYGHLIPIRRVKRAGASLTDDTFKPTAIGLSRVMIPVHGQMDNGKSTFTLRKCTTEFKIRPITKEIRTLMGLKPGDRAAGKFQIRQWFGISTDEAHRMRTSKDSWVSYEYPLIDQRMSRGDCIRFLEQRGIEAAKSSCRVCPFHSDTMWLEMKRNAPDDFQFACEFDEKLRHAFHAGTTALSVEPFLHRSCVPLRDVVFSAENQMDLFGNECEGMCGT